MRLERIDESVVKAWQQAEKSEAYWSALVTSTQTKLRRTRNPRDKEQLQRELEIFLRNTDVKFPYVVCGCSHEGFTGAYFEPGGMLSFHLASAGGQHTIHPLHKYYLEEGEYDLQSVKDSPLRHGNHAYVESRLLRGLPRQYRDARIEWSDPSQHGIRYGPLDELRERGIICPVHK